jgi:hypothetical protein
MIAYDSNYAFAIQHAFQRIIKLLEFVKYPLQGKRVINNLGMMYDREQ